jgi:hypothetical protein
MVMYAVSCLIASRQLTVADLGRGAARAAGKAVPRGAAERSAGGIRVDAATLEQVVNAHPQTLHPKGPRDGATEIGAASRTKEGFC